MFGYILFAITTIVLLFTSQIYTMLAVFIIYGIFYAMINGVQRAFVVDLAPTNLKATALGTFHTSIGLIAGMLWDTFSPNATFMFLFILATSAIIIFIFIKNSKTHFKT